MKERYELSLERIREINVNQEGLKDFCPYFCVYSGWIIAMADEYERILKEGTIANDSLEELKERNDKMYRDIMKDAYENSYVNPQKAVAEFGKEYGRPLCILASELRSLIGFVYEGKLDEIVIRMELFLEVFTCFQTAFAEHDMPPKPEELKDILYWFVSDYFEPAMERKVSMQTDWENDFFTRIIMESDLNDLRYLYQYGEYISENELKTASFIQTLDEETIDLIADAYVTGFIHGFEVVKKDLSRKKSVNIRYVAGFERIIKRAIEKFETKGLKPVIYRAGMDIFTRTGVNKIGFYGSIANPQYDYDHKEDMAYLLDGHLVTRKLECLLKAFELHRQKAAWLAGPACMEVFGEPTFIPKEKEENVRYDKKQQPLVVEERTKAGAITNQYIKQEERSFTIIAFPTAAIGKDFPEIFKEVVKINTLDPALYERIQQTIIDALDGTESVRIQGANQNKTDLTVALQEITNPETETKFENCVADVNIPAGEVFTTPKLKGTNGVLHVSRVFLNELEYRNLMLTFKDGVITDYSCENENGKAFIEENLLFHHKTLPMGEFAIGTNTTAYVMARKYGIEALLPILIAEKTGPHFAMGDSCYSHEEEVRVFNFNQKEMIAKENEYSLLRKSDPSKAYFYCHTDITIPYDELGLIEGICKDGNKICILKDGRFALPGTEELNRAFS